MAGVLNLCFSIFKGNLAASALFRRLVGTEIRRNRRKIFHKVTLRKYFPKNYTPQQMERVIIKLLDQWQKKRQHQNER